MSQLWQRQEHRVEYETTVRLFAPDELQPVVARTANLSQSGAFVNAPTLFDVGTELVCDLSLSEVETEDPLTVRGRVVWVYEPHDGTGGMGIAFEGLSAADLAVLRHVAGPAREEVRQLDVWFEGVPQAIRVEALPRPDGVRLRTSLPFLRLGSAVSFAREVVGLSGKQGLLRSVELILEGDNSLPCLELAIEPDLDGAEGLPDTPVVGPIIPGRTGVQLEVARPGRPLDDLREAQPVRGPLSESPALAPAGAATCTSDTARMAPLAKDPADGRIIAVDEDEGDRASTSQLELALDREASALSLDEPLALADDLGAGPDEIDVPPAEAASWQAASLAGALSTDSAEPWQAPPRVSARQTWLWMTGLAICGATLVWSIHAGIWAEVSQRLRSSEPGRGTAVSARKANEGSGSESRSAGLTRPRHPVIAANDSRATQWQRDRHHALQAAREGALEADKQLRIHRFGDSAVLAVPIEGTLAGATDYVMTDPPGLVVKLPRADARLPHDDYRVNAGGFGVVWVRREGGGLHLRFHFTAKGMQHTLTLADDRVAVTLSRAVEGVPPTLRADHEVTKRAGHES